MKRNLSDLAGRKFDLIVVGGGIFGACIAWDASLRGLSVALLERGDIGGATSANCFRIVHGGIRYLQHGDLWRTREAIRERRAMLRIAPHLVRPLPIAVPTYRQGRLSKQVLSAGARAYDILSLDRNRGIDDESSRIPRSRVISRAELTSLFPALPTDELTGAVVIHDGQMKNPARLTLEFIHSAVAYGAHVANYVDVNGLSRRNGRITGVRARDRLSADSFEVLGNTVVNATGPWADSVLRGWLGFGLPEQPMFSRDMFIVVNWRLGHSDVGLAIPARESDPSAIISRGRRHLFLVPRGDTTAIGVWHKVHQAEPDKFSVEDNEIERALSEVNRAFPSARIQGSDVIRAQAGLVPINGVGSSQTQVDFGRRSVIADHSQIHGVDGLISVIGVRYTTARHVGQAVVDSVFRRAGYRPPKCKTDEIALIGGRTGRFEDFVGEAEKHVQRLGIAVDSEMTRNLLHNHGSRYLDIFRMMKSQPALAQSLDGTRMSRAEVVHAVREEMAVTLEDLTMRRTNLCESGHPGKEVLRLCADLMAEEAGWDQKRTDSEFAMADAAA